MRAVTCLPLWSGACVRARRRRALARAPSLATTEPARKRAPTSTERGKTALRSALSLRQRTFAGLLPRCQARRRRGGRTAARSSGKPVCSMVLNRERGVARGDGDGDLWRVTPGISSSTRSKLAARRTLYRLPLFSVCAGFRWGLNGRFCFVWRLFISIIALHALSPEHRYGYQHFRNLGMVLPPMRADRIAYIIGVGNKRRWLAAGQRSTAATCQRRRRTAGRSRDLAKRRAAVLLAALAALIADIQRSSTAPTAAWRVVDVGSLLLTAKTISASLRKI